MAMSDIPKLSEFPELPAGWRWAACLPDEIDASYVNAHPRLKKYMNDGTELLSDHRRIVAHNADRCEAISYFTTSTGEYFQMDLARVVAIIRKAGTK